MRRIFHSKKGHLFYKNLHNFLRVQRITLQTLNYFIGYDFKHGCDKHKDKCHDDEKLQVEIDERIDDKEQRNQKVHHM